MRIIAGRWGGRTIRAPRGARTRPTTDRVREAWMSALQHDLPDAAVLDLYAGSGALGLEALSRGARHVTFVERAAAPLRALQANVDALGAHTQTVLVRGDAIAFVATLERDTFDITLADPPYDQDDAQRLVDVFERTPFTRLLCIEHDARAARAIRPPGRTRRYGDTALTFYTAPS